ncbi:FAD-binding oxidoreductase [Thalassovita sp.]|uniref:FAD-binding oxidoreductase n=1 Tax=Thalassovita sp. TaxID=1979401 RepID=UPI0029DE76BF|nr:FAD-binding oxidoreductase [Thalassovita sp.]
MKLSGWGRYPVIEARLSAPRDLDALIQLVRQGDAIARGNGRAYGDSAVSASNTIHLKHFNRMLAFDADTGLLEAESGVLLEDILEAFLPRGWFPFVTPGTKFVTLGGMIAADVHGKNHHKDGSFGRCVEWIDVVTGDGVVQRCSAQQNTELFEWTIGGMGLTGVILRAAIRLRPVPSAWIEQRILAAENISHAIDLFEQSMDTTYSVAWIDCLQTGKGLGRSLVMLGEHAKTDAIPQKHRVTPLQVPAKRKLSVPLDFPGWALNRFSVRAFNALYYWKGKHNTERQLVDWDTFFYPLDAILGWNRIYGRRGFAQFQCVIPLGQAQAGLTELLSVIAGAGAGSFLAVLKRFGPQDDRFSFPMEGYTLALDFPMNRTTLALLNDLDSITMRYGGRFYLAKDSRMGPEVFRLSEQRAEAYARFRTIRGDASVFRSAQSERLEY